MANDECGMTNEYPSLNAELSFQAMVRHCRVALGIRHSAFVIRFR